MRNTEHIRRSYNGNVFLTCGEPCSLVVVGLHGNVRNCVTRTRTGSNLWTRENILSRGVACWLNESHSIRSAKKESVQMFGARKSSEIASIARACSDCVSCFEVSRSTRATTSICSDISPSPSCRSGRFPDEDAKEYRYHEYRLQLAHKTSHNSGGLLRGIDNHNDYEN